MARGGINKTLVHKARQAILARGDNSSIDAVRVELGNTGSRTTIHRYLKEIEEAELGRNAPSVPLSEQLANLIGQLADQLKEEAQASVTLEREQLAEERGVYQNQARQAESRIQQLEAQCTRRREQLQTALQALDQEQQVRQQAAVENARLLQANRGQEVRLEDRAGQIHSLEEKHQHARDALEHYRQAAKEQREQEQRRHESQLQQLQLELRHLQQALIVKQDELTHLNRDNARLLAEARQQQKEQYAQQQLLTQKTQSLEVAQSALASIQRTNEALEQRCHALQDEVTRFGEASLIQAQQAQTLQQCLAEATAQLKLLGQASPATGSCTPAR